MKPSTRLCGWIALITVLHTTEQLVFGLGELQNLKRMIGASDGWFQNPDTATVAFVTVVAGVLYLAIFSILRGGRAKFVALVALNMAALGEVHHFIESAYAGRYTPGTVTAIPYIIFGILFLRALIYERRTEKAVGAQVGAQAAVSTA
jgi:hypothetical protein